MAGFEAITSAMKAKYGLMVPIMRLVDRGAAPVQGHLSLCGHRRGDHALARRILPERSGAGGGERGPCGVAGDVLVEGYGGGEEPQLDRRAESPGLR